MWCNRFRCPISLSGRAVLRCAACTCTGSIKAVVLLYSRLFLLSITLQETEDRLQRLQTCKDSCNCGIFGCLSCIQYNLVLFNAKGQNTAITMWTEPMKRGNCRRFEQIPPIHNGFEMKAIKRGSEFLGVCSRLSAYVLQYNDTKSSKNYTICKIHVSDIFPTDWAGNRRSAMTLWATTGSEWSEMLNFQLYMNSLEHNVWHVQCREALHL